jgi:ABC-2 type transport system ATP-binding protein
MTGNPTILVQNLYKQFGLTRAVDGLSLQVSVGEIYGLVGPDGAGKTTTLRLLCGALLPSTPENDLETRLEIGDFDVVHQPEEVRSLIGYLPQHFSMYEEMTVLENLRFFAEVRGLSRSEWQPRCMEILSFVGLDGFTGRLAGLLSGGMKQKLGLAAALVHQPGILLLDEPTTGVDPVTRQDFWKLIIRLVREERTTVLVSTPYMDEAVRCQRLGFMQNGKLLREGTPGALQEVLAGRVLEVRGKHLTAVRDLARRDPDTQDAHLFGDRLHLRVAPGQIKQTIQRLKREIRQAGLEVSVLHEVHPQLEDTFMALMDGEA